MSAIQASSGQGWARAAVAVGAVLSVAGNATETVLTPSPVNLAIRITIAIFLPVIVFIAVEVFVRVAWRKTLLDFTGRAMLILLPSFGAAYVSFGHLYNLSRMSGADEIAASANALAIDGLMIGGTIALLAIRAARLAEAVAPVAQVEQIETDPEEVSTRVDERAVPGQGGSPATPVRQSHTGPVLVYGGPEQPASMGSAASGRRAPRGNTSEAMRDAVMALLDGATVKEAAEKFSVPVSTLGRYHTLRRRLAESAPADHAEIAADSKTRPDLAALLLAKMHSPEGMPL